MDWDEYFFNIAYKIAEKSKDPSTKFGAAIVREDNSIASVGFNGFPRGVVDSDSRYDNRPVKYKFVVHAEENAICSAAKTGVSIDKCILYISTFPCSTCCKSIIQAGIKEIVLDGDSLSYNDEAFNTRWKEEIEITKTMCNEAGIKIRIYKRQ